MEKEIETLKRNETWSLVPRPENKKVLSNKWVFKTKRNTEGQVERYKARLVARGHIQKAGIDYEEIFAPVTKLSELFSQQQSRKKCTYIKWMWYLLMYKEIYLMKSIWSSLKHTKKKTLK